VQQFDEDVLRERLAELSTDGRAAFAAACATRQQAVIDADAFPDAIAMLDDLWTHLGGDRRPETELLRLADCAEACVPEPEPTDDWQPSTALAQNAIAALAYSLRCAVTGEPQLAVWSARQAIDALEVAVAPQFNAWVFDAELEAAIDAHPAIRAEVAHQARDLDQLAACPVPSKLVEKLRRRAVEERPSFLTG
jgi:hypothetical protein